MKTIQINNSAAKKQKGVAAVEFAIIATVFLTLLFGIVEFGRVLFTWNSAVEATRFGARTAVVCDIGSDAVLRNMRKIMPNLTASNVNVSFEPVGCTANSCRRVYVSTKNISITTLIPFFNLRIPVPSFETSLMRESLASASNPVCS